MRVEQPPQPSETDRWREQLNQQLEHITLKRVVVINSVNDGLPMVTLYWWPRAWADRARDPFITATMVPYRSEQGSWNVLEISSQRGCIAKCQMCGVPALRVPQTTTERSTYDNLPLPAMVEQLTALRLMKAELGISDQAMDKVLLTDGGESLLREDFPELLTELWRNPANAQLKISTVGVDTVLHRRNIAHAIDQISQGRPIRLQWSVMSTNEAQRRQISGISLMPLTEVNQVAQQYQQATGHRMTVSFTVMGGAEISPQQLRETLDPTQVVVRVHYAKHNGVQHITGFQSPQVEQLDKLVEQLRQQGFSVVYTRPDEATMNRLGLTGTVSHLALPELMLLAEGWK